ncbi:hypothetical protein [Cytobacillus sp. NCCP-133]|uniref:hypothetical protein n=1 Tax=Cytobacillus sp. NCCP-133 TaxID=766848 RepID=UPI00222E6B93|nr:hypothetical protein [Cytobacillus sp. NCCP-133]GLB59664.1 hypothetical protein NCCP133_17960 [Cytobacillus sp. NCCP-133]
MHYYRSPYRNGGERFFFGAPFIGGLVGGFLGGGLGAALFAPRPFYGPPRPFYGPPAPFYGPYSGYPGYAPYGNPYYR